MVFGLTIWKEFFLRIESCKWCVGLLAVTYTNQKAVSSYILLQVKPKLPNVKIGSCRSPDAMGGMDNGFNSCAAPAFCCSPGISNIGRCMHFPWATGKS